MDSWGDSPEDRLSRAVLPVVLPVISFAMSLWICVPLFFGAISTILIADGLAGLAGPVIGVVLSGALAVALGYGPFLLSDVRGSARRRRQLQVSFLVVGVVALVVALIVANSHANQPLAWVSVGLYFVLVTVVLDRLRRPRIEAQ